MGTVDDLDVQLRIAADDLSGARAAFAHSPNAETASLVVIAQTRVDRLLDRRHNLTTAEAIVSR